MLVAPSPRSFAELKHLEDYLAAEIAACTELIQQELDFGATSSSSRILHVEMDMSEFENELTEVRDLIGDLEELEALSSASALAA